MITPPASRKENCMPRMVSTGTSALGSACRHSTRHSPAPLARARANVVLVQRVDQRAAQHARQNRGLRHGERNRGQRQRLQRRPESRLPAGESAGGNPVQPIANSSTSSIPSQKFGTARPSCVMPLSDRHRRRARVSPRPYKPTGKATPIDSSRAYSASGNDTCSRSAMQMRRPECDRCSSSRNRHAASRRPSAGSAARAPTSSPS